MKNTLYLLLPLLAFVACTDSGTENGSSGEGNNDTPVYSTLDVNESSLYFDTAQDVKTIEFYSSDDWTAEIINDRADDWCSIEPTSGKAGQNSILVTASANDSPDERTASVLIKNKTLQRVVKVVQKQKDAITTTSSSFEITSAGGEVEIEVKANISYDYTIEDKARSWVSYKATRAMQSRKLVFEVDENAEVDKREAKITFYNYDGNIKEVVTIYQDGATPSIILSQNEYTVSDKGKTLAVTVKSNVNVAIEIPAEIDWIKENSTRAMSTNTFYLNVSPNTEYSSRSAAIKVIGVDNGVSESILITQAQKDAIVIALDNYTIDNNGGEIEIEVGHNIGFDVTISNNWITQKTTRALENSTLVFNIAANTSTDGREGTIKFTSRDKTISQTVKIIQTQKDALILSKKDFVIDERAQYIEFVVRSNVEVVITDPKETWINRNGTRAMTSQTIRYNVTANTDYDSRTAYITVKSLDGSLAETVTVTQAQKDAIVIAKSNYEIGSDGGNINIEVGHNVDFNIQITGDWISNVSTRAFETETLTFNIAANTTNDNREGSIKFVSKDGSVSQTVKVYQAQNNALIISKKDIVINDKSQTISFVVKSNVEYTVGTPSANWVRPISTRAMTSRTIQYNIDANTSYDSRSATIAVQSTDGTLKETITITQAQKDAIVIAKSSYTVDCNSNQIDIEVGHNVDFDVEISEDWVTQTTTRALTQSKLVFNIEANSSTESREAKITFKKGDISNTVTIQQEGSVPHITITQDEYTISDRGETVMVAVSSNVDVAVNIPESANWIVLSSSENGYQFTVAPNTTYESRSVNIEFTNAEHGLSESITIIQTQKDAIVVAKNLYNLDGDSTTLSIDVGHNVDFDIEISDSWITQITTRAFETETLTFNIEANWSSENREGTIKFVSKDGSVSQIIKIVQSFKTIDPAPNEIWVKVTCAEDVLKSKFSTAINQGIGWYSIPLNTIPDGAFRSCNWLTDVAVGNNITAIRSGAFDRCNSLTSVSIGNGVKWISNEAFMYCTSLTSITIPDSVTEIGERAFYGCTSLINVTLGDGITSVGAYAFSDCTSLTTFYGKFASPDHRCFIINNTLIAYANASGTSYTIPDNVTSLDGYGSFAGCSSLTSIIIGDSVTTIGGATFTGCTSLKSVTISDSVTSIGEYAFYNCRLLTSVYCKRTTPPTGGGSMFSGTISNLKIYVPMESVDAYKTADGWKTYADIIVGYNFNE